MIEWRITRALLREVEGDRRAVAKAIIHSRLSNVGFLAPGCAQPGHKLTDDRQFGKLMKIIPDYPTDIGV